MRNKTIEQLKEENRNLKKKVNLLDKELNIVHGIIGEIYDTCNKDGLQTIRVGLAKIDKLHKIKTDDQFKPE